MPSSPVNISRLAKLNYIETNDAFTDGDEAENSAGKKKKKKKKKKACKAFFCFLSPTTDVAWVQSTFTRFGISISATTVTECL